MTEVSSSVLISNSGAADYDNMIKQILASPAFHSVVHQMCSFSHRKSSPGCSELSELRYFGAQFLAETQGVFINHSGVKGLQTVVSVYCSAVPGRNTKLKPRSTA